MTIKLIIKEELDQQIKDIFIELQKGHKEKVEGIYELYDALYINGRCESYSLDRIYYVAYTLATRGINFIIK